MDNNTFYSERCVVCLEITKLLYFFIPCLHKCICQICALKYKSQENEIFDTCPMCRKSFSSIEFDESEITDDNEDEAAIKEAPNKNEQSWAELEKSLETLKLLISNIDHVPMGNRNQENVDLHVTHESPPIACERPQLRSQSLQELKIAPRMNIAGPSHSQNIESNDEGRNERRIDDADRSEFMLEDASDLRSSASTGAVPRTSSPFVFDTEYNRISQSWEDDYEWADPLTTIVTNLAVLPLPITVIQREIMNTVFQTEGTTLVGITKVHGIISINYPINLYFILNAHPNSNRLNFTLKYSQRLYDIDHPVKDVCQRNSNEHGVYFTIHMCKLKELIPKLVKKERIASSLTSTVLRYTTKSSSRNSEHLYPLILIADWDVQKFTTNLTIRYKYLPIARIAALQDVQVTVHMNASFVDFEAEPAARREANKLIWKLPNPEQLDNASANNNNEDYRQLTAKIQLTQSIIRNLTWRLKATRKGKISVQFMGTGITLSGCDFHLFDTNSFTLKGGVKMHFQSGEEKRSYI